jgi:hypothetical protein
MSLSNDRLGFVGAGSAAAPVITLGGDGDSGIYSIGANNFGMSVGAGLVMDWEDTNAAGAGADLVTISSTLGIMDDNADTFRGLFIDLTNANHTAAVTSPIVYGLDIDGITGDAQAVEYAINIGAGWDRDIVFEDLNVVISYANAGVFDITDAGGAHLLRLIDVPAAGNGAALAELNYVINAFDNNDTMQGLLIDFTNADHTGTSNFLYGLEIDGITGDAEAIEYAINIGAGWDAEIAFSTVGRLRSNNVELFTMDYTSVGTTKFVFGVSGTHTGTSSNDFMLLNPTIGAVDGSDAFALLSLDVTNADHTGTGNDFYAIQVDDITEDADAYETAMMLEGGWDTHITLFETGQQPAAAQDYPPTGAIGIFLDDNADYSGGGGNDCALLGIDSAGNVTVIATFVLNGACP